MRPLTRTECQGPFVLSLICALANGLQQAEPVKHSARVNRLAKVEETAMRAIDFYPDAELTPQVQELAAEFFDRVEKIFVETVAPPLVMDEKRQSQIAALISTSVDDCRSTIALMDDASLLQAVLDHMDKNNIDGKTRRQVIARRIRAINKQASQCA
ncbi:MAG: hypothetical protein AB7D06_08785 [Pedobacter sp.]